MTNRPDRVAVSAPPGGIDADDAGRQLTRLTALLIYYYSLVLLYKPGFDTSQLYVFFVFGTRSLEWIQISESVIILKYFGGVIILYHSVYPDL